MKQFVISLFRIVYSFYNANLSFLVHVLPILLILSDGSCSCNQDSYFEGCSFNCLYDNVGIAIVL